MLLRIALIAFFATFSASLAPADTECTATETTPGTGCACCM